MEKFDQKIRNKLSSIEYTQAPNEHLMSEMFDQLGNSQNPDIPVFKLPQEPNRNKTRILFYRVAASVAFLIAIGISIYRINDINIYASKGNRLTHQLPDGSSVTLNADSKINYNKVSWLFSRNIALEGEAFFEVEKGKKFTVSSGKSKTQVLGTHFNIYARGQDYKVECITGSVKVTYLGGINNIILTPGKGVVFGESQEGDVFEFIRENRIDWRNGEFYFNNDPLKKVLEVLSRQYNIEVKIDEKYDQKKYSGYFNNNDLETALKLICEPIDLTFQISNGIVEIK